MKSIGDAQLAPAGRAAGSRPAPGSRRRAPRPARRRPATSGLGGRARAPAPRAGAGRRTVRADRRPPGRRAGRRRAPAAMSRAPRGLPDAPMPWMASGSAICAPIVQAAVERAQRILVDHLHAPPQRRARHRCPVAASAAPSKRDLCRRPARSMPSASRPVVDLPQPDSPTRPRVRPRCSDSDTPSTARQHGLGREQAAAARCRGDRSRLRQALMQRPQHASMPRLGARCRRRWCAGPRAARQRRRAGGAGGNRRCGQRGAKTQPGGMFQARARRPRNGDRRRRGPVSRAARREQALACRDGAARRTGRALGACLDDAAGIHHGDAIDRSRPPRRDRG